MAQSVIFQQHVHQQQFDSNHNNDETAQNKLSAKNDSKLKTQEKQMKNKLFENTSEYQTDSSVISLPMFDSFKHFIPHPITFDQLRYELCPNETIETKPQPEPVA